MVQEYSDRSSLVAVACLLSVCIGIKWYFPSVIYAQIPDAVFCLFLSKMTPLPVLKGFTLSMVDLKAAQKLVFVPPMSFLFHLKHISLSLEKENEIDNIKQGPYFPAMQHSPSALMQYRTSGSSLKGFSS